MDRIPQLPSLRLCISAGAPLTKQSAGLFSAKLGLKIHTFYGSSECGGIAYDSTEERLYEDGFVGTPLRGVRIRKLGGPPSGTEVAAGGLGGEVIDLEEIEDGEGAEDPGPIEVQSDAVGDGYFPEDEPDILGDGGFVPADVIQRGQRGYYIVGRTSEVINVAGRKLNPHEVEARLAEFPGVRQAVVFGVESPLRGEEPIACVAGSNLSRDALLRFCKEKLSPWQVPRDLWMVKEIPTNERGKVSRRALAESYRAQHEDPS
jgi:long-chain acyl-CoA synthetase